jgi:hypothetical protein
MLEVFGCDCVYMKTSTCMDTGFRGSSKIDCV